MSTAAVDPGLDTPYEVTEEQLRTLHEDSWALVPNLLDADTVERLRTVVAPTAPREVIPGPGKRPVDLNQIQSVEGLAWYGDPFVREVATSRRMATAILGLMKQPRATFVQDISFYKPPGAIGTPFHQDHSYFPFDRQGCLTLWIALVDMPPEVGPLHYLERSHRDGPLGYRHPDIDIRDVYPELRDRRIVGGGHLRPGDAQAHWDLTIHGSKPNVSDRVREAIAFRYVRPDTVYNAISHPHYDRFGLEFGQKYGELDVFPQISLEDADR